LGYAVNEIVWSGLQVLYDKGLIIFGGNGAYKKMGGTKIVSFLNHCQIPTDSLIFRTVERLLSTKTMANSPDSHDYNPKKAHLQETTNVLSFLAPADRWFYLYLVSTRCNCEAAWAIAS
jgi:hypothetical protein